MKYDSHTYKSYHVKLLTTGQYFTHRKLEQDSRFPSHGGNGGSGETGSVAKILTTVTYFHTSYNILSNLDLSSLTLSLPCVSSSVSSLWARSWTEWPLPPPPLLPQARWVDALRCCPNLRSLLIPLVHFVGRLTFASHFEVSGLPVKREEGMFKNISFNF